MKNQIITSLRLILVWTDLNESLVCESDSTVFNYCECFWYNHLYLYSSSTDDCTDLTPDPLKYRRQLYITDNK